MLRQLKVRNLALAEDVSVEFAQGLNVITGETGAGKSLLVGALALLLGERADKGLLRTGADTGSAEAVFELADTAPADAVLAHYGLPPCEDGQLVVRRVLRTNGGQNLVNDAAVTLPVLRDIGERLVDLHGPHDHQSLFHTSAQLAVLDAFGHTGAAREAYAAPHDRLLALLARREQLEADGAATPEQLDLLRYRIKEIEQAAPEEGEEERVREEHALVGNAQRVLELASGVVDALAESDTAAFSGLAAVQRPLEELERLLPAAAAWREEAASLAARVQELSSDIQREAARIEADPARLEWLDRRLETYRTLHRKYGATVAEVLQTLTEARQRLRDLDTLDEQRRALEADIRRVRAELDAAGRALREKRLRASEALAEAVTGELRFLGFPDSAFAVGLRPCEPRADGMDEAEFGFAPNPGEAMRPLRAIASSGEISRVMLATKAVLAQHDLIPVLVFDEIDANLGGEMGNAVGRELAGVAARHQVICITHLPQVAAHGTTHLAVSKDVRDGRTYSRVAPLDGEHRIRELARMLGDAASETGLRHARELRARAARAPGRRRAAR